MSNSIIAVGKDGEEGYTSECDRVDWDWDNEVQERETGYTGENECNRKYRTERKGSVGDVEQQENKEDAGDEP